YRELDERVNAFAHGLLDMGIRKGQTVGLFMKNCPEYLVSWFAVTRISAVVCPLNPSYKEHEVAYHLNNSEGVAVVVQHELLPLVETLRAKIPTLKRVISVGPDTHVLEPHLHSFNRLLRAYPTLSPAVPKPAWEEVIALPYSSGTTGLPKGVML